MTVDVTLCYAVSPTGEMVSVKDVPRGLRCECTCPECHKPLIAKQGSELVWHFAHEGDYSCAGARETQLHMLAKEIIAEDRGIRVPEITANDSIIVMPTQWVAADTVSLEEWQYGIRPDIVVRRGSETVIVEVYVSHKCEEKKLDLLRARGSAALEIDLSRFPRVFDRSRLREQIRAGQHSWLYHPIQSVRDVIISLQNEARQASIAAYRAQASLDGYARDVQAAEARTRSMFDHVDATARSHRDWQRGEVTAYDWMDHTKQDPHNKWVSGARQVIPHAQMVAGLKRCAMQRGSTWTGPERDPPADVFCSTCEWLGWWSNDRQTWHCQQCVPPKHSPTFLAGYSKRA